MSISRSSPEVFGNPILAPTRLAMQEVSNPGAGTVYTVGGGQAITIEQIILANSGAGNLTSVSIGAPAAGTRIFTGTIGASATVTIPGPIYLVDGETLQAIAALVGETISVYGFRTA